MRLGSLLNVRIDRVQTVCRAATRFRCPDIPGYAVVSDFFVPPQTSIRTYGRVRRYRNFISGTQLFLQYDPKCPWLATFKLTFIADDWRGLQRPELEKVLKQFPPYRLLTVEVAFDFSSSSEVGTGFVGRHALFGKSKPSTSGTYPNEHRFGTRRSHKFVRCYPKEELGAYRVELELHSAWLRMHHIHTLRQMRCLPNLVFPKHFRFAQIGWDLVQTTLLRWRLPDKRILRLAQLRAGRIHRVLNYLGQVVGLTNVHRFLQDMALTDEVRAEFQRWSRRW